MVVRTAGSFHRLALRLLKVSLQRPLIAVLAGTLMIFGTTTQVGAAVHAAPDQAAIGTSGIHLRLSAMQVTVGTQVMVTVVVTPRSPGRVVTLQRRGQQGWRNLEIKTTSSSGKALFRLRDRAVASERIGAIVAPSTTSAAARSKSLVLNVTPVPPPYSGRSLAPGDTGPLVVALQQRLQSLGYWVGSANGNFGDATEQAVYAIQKAAGLPRSGVVGPTTVDALQNGVLPVPRSQTGYVIEVNLHDDLVMFVRNGTIEYVLNTSTGGGYTYTQDGATDVATTPTGVYSINRVVDGLVVDSLGALWRPRFFYEGFAIHGDGYVPPEPVSHGCVRVSNEAIDWIWGSNLAPVGTKVWVY